MQQPLLSLCSVPRPAIRDGYAGTGARLYLFGYGYWFANGQELTFPDSTMPQAPRLSLDGRYMPDVFQKDCCNCA